MNGHCEDWGREWDCRCYLFETGYGTEVLIEDADDLETIKAELDHQGLHYDEDWLETLHLNVDVFKEYLETEYI